MRVLTYYMPAVYLGDSDALIYTFILQFKPKVNIKIYRHQRVTIIWVDDDVFSGLQHDCLAWDGKRFRLVTIHDKFVKKERIKK